MTHTITATTEDICNMIDGLQLLHTQINSKIAEITAILHPAPKAPPKRRKRKFSKDARRRMAEAQQRRWAKLRTVVEAAQG